MTDPITPSASCASCGTPYPAELVPSLYACERPGCACGAIAVHLSVSAVDHAEVHEMLTWKAKGDRDGKRKVYQEGKSGEEFNRNLQRWVTVSRGLDRDKDWYDEVITDPTTGEVLREVHEPLSQHRDRGAARPDRRERWH